MTPTVSTPLALIQAALGKLSTEELQTLKSSIDLRLRRSFTYGQLVEFTDRSGAQVQMRIDRINAKTLGGMQTGGAGGHMGMKWRVHPSFCKLVSGDTPVAPARAPLFASVPVTAPPLTALHEGRPDFGAF